MNPTINRETMRGQALIMAMIFLLVLTFLGFGLMILATVDRSSSHSMRVSEQVLNAAEEGALAAMTWAGDARTEFKGHSIGYSEVIRSDRQINGNPLRDPHDLFQFQTTAIIQGRAPVPKGNSMGRTSSSGTTSGDESFVVVEVRSTGYLNARQGIFDFNHLPPVSRTLNVLARVRVM